MNKYEKYLKSKPLLTSRMYVGLVAVLNDGQRFYITNGDAGRYWGRPVRGSGASCSYPGWHWDINGVFHRYSIANHPWINVNWDQTLEAAV